MSWKHLPILAFDTETTGLQPFSGDRIIEFAAVQFYLGDDGRPAVAASYSWLLDPRIPIPKKVTEITGIDDAKVAGQKQFREIAGEVFNLLRGSVAVAHNFPFDMAFLTQELGLAGLHWPEPIAEVDTVDVSMLLYPDARSHKLGDLCKRLDVSLVEAHRATNDAEACGRCFLEMARRNDVGDDLQQMLRWARAIGHPPAGGPIGTSETGRLVFLEGPYAGQPIGEQPLHLAWMLKARERTASGWAFRYDHPVRDWVRRWLEVRGAGRHRPNAKSFRSDDWGLDPCIADDRRVGL
jgi:DNA polymerase III epsilon subunit family exonuclease